ncbi:MAG: class I SAM-dependent methyltransferase [Candidatus Sulfotelmatobacter sp.]
MNRPQTLDEVTQQGRDRLFPSLTNPNWLVLRARRRIFERWLTRLPSGELDVLDVGGRIQPYRALITNRLRRYVAVDLRLTPLVDVLARAEQLPLGSARFDLVICTQVLEYVAQPSLVFGEIHRVLKPGGALLLSVPSACPIDAGEECWRFLPAGLRYLLAGFSTVEVVPEGGSVAGFFRTVNTCLDIFVRYPAARFAYRRTLAPLVNLGGALMERLSGLRNEQFSVNYSVLAEK